MFDNTLTLTPCPLQNRRVVLSDSDNSDESTDDANVTKRSPSPLGLNTNPSVGDPSNNSSGNDIRDISGKSDEEKPSAVSKQRDPIHRDSSIHLDTDTQIPISSSHTVKRKADKWDIHPHNIMSPSPQAFNELNSPRGHCESPQKRLRVTRGHGQRNVNYDMKHHPMDDILRPKYSAKRRRNGLKVPDEDNSNNTTSERATSPKPYRPRSSRNIHRSEMPIYSAKWHPLDQILEENYSSTSISNKDDHSKEIRKTSNSSSSTLEDDEDSVTINSDLNPNQDADIASGFEGEATSISPERRRSARVSSYKDAPPNYDMKYGDVICKKSTLRLIATSRYHVMDSTLRPKAAARRIKSKLRSATSSKTLSKSVSSAKTHTKQLAKASPNSLTRRSIHLDSESDSPDIPVAPAWSQLHNPYLNRSSLDWAEIQEMDRCIYLLQKGAPLHGSTLPQDWNQDAVKKVLFDEGVITLDELNSREGTELLKSRYESVRLGLQNFYGSRPEPVSRNEWTLSRTESFDVYDMKRGLKYWKHQRDSIVEGTKTRSSSKNVGFASETAKHMTRNINQKATHSVSDQQDRNEAGSPTSVQQARDDGTTPSESSSPRPSAMEVNAERRLSVDYEDDDEIGAIIETEDSLIENMRGEHVPSSIMSDAALEELLFPVERSLRDESNQEVTPSSISSDSRRCGSAGSITAHPDKTLAGEEVTVSGVDADPRDRFYEPYTPKTEVKTRKRKSRVDGAIVVHEDPPGRTPLVKKIIGMNPASPGTDIPKENFEDDGSVDHSSQVEMGTPRTHPHPEAGGTPSTRRIRRLESAAIATPPYRPIFGGSSDP